MTELRTPIQLVEVDKGCICNIGRMRPTGTVLTSIPPKYPHACNRCGRTETYEVSYPYQTHEPMTAGGDGR